MLIMKYILRSLGAGGRSFGLGETVAMISDILSAIIIFLMAVLILYPTSRALMKSWHERQRRLGGGEETARRR